MVCAGGTVDMLGGPVGVFSSRGADFGLLVGGLNGVWSSVPCDGEGEGKGAISQL